MAVPLDAIRAIHNAFRKEMAAIDGAANKAAHGQGGLDLISKRAGFFNEVLVWHADGEEEFVFPAVEKVAPLVYEPYERDHRGLDSLAERLDKAVVSNDLIEIARAASAFSFHLSFHLDKEEAHLYRIFNERIALPDQGVIVGKMSQKIPQDRFPEAVAWFFPLIGPDDRENVTRIWQKAFPAPVFATAAGLIRGAIGSDWAELTRRMPELKG